MVDNTAEACPRFNSRATRGRFDAMPPEDIRDGAARNVVPQVEERTLDPTIPPSAVFFRHPHHQPLDLVGCAQPPCLLASATVVLLRDQSSVPGQQRIRRDDS
jgi:hypothetical protein